jgi:hypothetical protein
MGDATKGRIADLASGWDVPPEAKGALAEPEPPPAPPPRPPASSSPAVASAAPEPIAPAAEAPRYPPAKRPSDAPKPGPPQTAIAGELPVRRPKGRTQPPPPPGSLRRGDGADAPSGPIAAAASGPVAAAGSAASGPVSLPLPPPPGTAVPPPPPPARAKPPSRPPPVPPARGKPDSRPDSADDDEPTRANESPVGGAAAAAPARPLGPPPGLDDSGFAEQQKATVKPDPSKGVMKRILDATPIPGPEILRPVGTAAPDAPPHRPSSPGFEAPQATVVDDAPAGLVAGAGPRGSRGDPTVVPSGDDGAPQPPALPAPPPRADPSQGSTNRFERGDPTGVMPEDDGAEPERDDATVAQRSPTVGLTATINLRPEAMLPRKRGVFGDVRYVFTVLFGTARARREAVTVGHAIARQLHERKQRLVALGRAAIVSERFDHPALVTAREQLAEIEEDRSHHAGAIAAADDELEHVKRERAKRAKQTAEAITAQRTQLAEIAQKLAPLEKESMTIRRKAGDLAEQLRKVDTKIRTTEASLTSVKTRKEDRAGVLAEIATLKADREAVQRDEPALAEQLDRLAPRMAGLEAKHHDAQARITELEADEATDQQRAVELIAAIEAKKKVVERSHGDAEARRDKALHGLAERLLIDRPSQLGRAFEPIDEIDLQIATDGRRAMELRELLGSVDRGAMARGIALMAVVLIGAGAGVVLALL